MPIWKQHISKRGFLYLRLDTFYFLILHSSFPNLYFPKPLCVSRQPICISFLLKFKVEQVQLKPTFAGRKRFGQKFSLSFQTFFDCFHSSRSISEALLVQRSKILVNWKIKKTPEMAKGTNRILLVPLHLVEQTKPSNGHRRIKISRAPKNH